eukprot:scpid77894/ scgid22478/ 
MEDRVPTLRRLAPVMPRSRLYVREVKTVTREQDYLDTPELGPIVRTNLWRLPGHLKKLEPHEMPPPKPGSMEKDWPYSSSVKEVTALGFMDLESYAAAPRKARFPIYSTRPRNTTADSRASGTKPTPAMKTLLATASRTNFTPAESAAQSWTRSNFRTPLTVPPKGRIAAATANAKAGIVGKSTEEVVQAYTRLSLRNPPAPPVLFQGRTTCIHDVTPGIERNELDYFYRLYLCTKHLQISNRQWSSDVTRFPDRLAVENLTFLCLSKTQLIVMPQDLAQCGSLCVLLMSNNRLSSLGDGILEKLPLLTRFSVKSNRLQSLDDTIRELKSIPYLRDLNLRDNPCVTNTIHRMQLIESIPTLDYLNEIQVSMVDETRARLTALFEDSDYLDERTYTW